MGHRYRADDGFYRGTRFTDELEALGEKLAREVFDSNWASLRPLSGHSADMLAVSTTTTPGDSILTVKPSDGGYDGLGERGYPPMVGVRNLYFPFDSEQMNINVDKAQAFIKMEKPRLVMFGQSFFIFPHPVKQLVEACRDTGAIIGFDGSHVLGLIAGGRFQQPLKEGADLLLGSTHKSFFGPQGGIILGSAKLESRVKARQFPGMIDNAHWNRIAALTWALDEFRRKGARYAGQVISNAKALANALHERGVPVKCPDLGFTESHQVILNINEEGRIRKLSDLLEQANIIADNGMRLGTNEVTRRGMKEGEMDSIAEMVAAVYRGEDPANIKLEAMRLRKQFQSILYV